MEIIVLALIALTVAWATGLLKLGGQSVDAARDMAANRIEVVTFESDIKKAKDMAKAHNNMGDALVDEYAEARNAAKSLRTGLKSVAEANEE